MFGPSTLSSGVFTNGQAICLEDFAQEIGVGHRVDGDGQQSITRREVKVALDSEVAATDYRTQPTDLLVDTQEFACHWPCQRFKVGDNVFVLDHVGCEVWLVNRRLVVLTSTRSLNTFEAPRSNTSQAFGETRRVSAGNP